MRLIAASTLDDYRRSGAYLIDLRTKEEYEKGHIEGAVNIPYDFLEDYKKRLPRNRLLVLYCEWGTTSILAGRKLSQYGYDVLSVNGGLQAYRRFSNMYLLYDKCCRKNVWLTNIKTQNWRLNENIRINCTVSLWIRGGVKKRDR